MSKQKTQTNSEMEAEYKEAINNIFENIGNTNVLQQGISNRERFLQMAEHEERQGNLGARETYKNMAHTQSDVEKFLSSLSGRSWENEESDDEL